MWQVALHTDTSVLKFAIQHFFLFQEPFECLSCERRCPHISMICSMYPYQLRLLATLSNYLLLDLSGSRGASQLVFCSFTSIASLDESW
jgi:hypothetical protein